jgi:hypothetical protein
VTLKGTNLSTVTSVNVSGFFVSASGINVVSDTEITATFNIFVLAPHTARNVTVTTAGSPNTSNAVQFTVTN